MSKKSKGLKHKMLLSAVLPSLLVFAIILITAYIVVSLSISRTVKNELQDMCNVVANTYNRAFPGEYKSLGDKELAIYKGDELLNDNYAIIDDLVKGTDLDITLFYEDIRVISTIKNSDNSRISGSNAPQKIKSEVLDDNKDKFYDNVKLNGNAYYAYYHCLYNSDGSCVGMIAVSKPANSVNDYIFKRLIPIFIISILGMVFIAYVSVKNTNSIVSVIKRLQSNFKDVASGKLNSSVDSKILKRDDEFADMAKSVVTMQQSLRKMVEFDTLTEINNRRYGENKLQQIMTNARNNGTEFSVAIGDIDFFKKVNDTYGHDNGDAVLITVAKTLREAIGTKGFVARWGGEEFLLVFDRISFNESVELLGKALDEIRSKRIETKNKQIIAVTMSFGITEGDCNEETRILLKRADERLYTAKESGRNRIISE